MATNDQHLESGIFYNRRGRVVSETGELEPTEFTPEEGIPPRRSVP